jgi:hypothetical protein
MKAMAGQYHGEVGPIYGRWQWPLKIMQMGDWFHVDHLLRNPEEVRHYVSVRAAQLGKRFSVMANDPDKPGYAKVWMPEPTEAGEGVPAFAALDYDKARTKFRELYSYPLDHLPAGQLHHKGRAEVEISQLKAPMVNRIVFPLPPHEQVGAKLYADRIVFEVLPDGASPEQWAKQVDLDDIMS